MNERTHFKVVAALYDLLAQYTYADFAAASRVETLSANLKLAIHSLALESRQQSSEESRKPVRRAQVEARGHSSSARDYARLVQFLSNPSIFPSREAVLQQLKSDGVAVKNEPKMSRDRLAKRAAAKIMSDAALRERLIDRWGLAKLDNQTAGWLNVIVGNKR